ncbi:hypothetical protein [Nonomuraea jabiensis]|uniref:DUF2637 domain-containing protein n=1 Tax=Nonomuraea jabiensis TaxID=882448 RepID=A0A7W9G4A9_9ACTN|nr:hypothetical protein [Nonomuraea jabiensis]MBB5776889.1 hypothetical protein [Nonomuraea jabiensis]
MTPPSMLRRLGIALAGLAVAALTGAACALSFDDLRALAITGEARQDLAFLYPAALDALLVIALIDVLLLRSARLLVRVQAAFVLVVLIVAAAAADVATAVRFAFDVRATAVGVALAPWVMLAVALWLWLLLIKHVQAHRSESEESAAEQDIVPFQPGPERQPVPERPPVEIYSERLSEETPRPAPVPEAPEPVQEVVEAPAPLAAQVAEWPVQNEEAPERPTRPVRWGDRVKPTDVLVHPRVDEKDVDTQPHPVIEDDVPDPGHGPELADDLERPREDELEDTAPHPVIQDDDAPAPAERLRSTPRHPED